jgi:CarD family transcriptional regulator
MASRKKSAKKTASHSAKTPKRAVTTAAKSAKNSAERKSKASKSLTKLEKAALAAKQKAAKAKAAAKNAKNSASQTSAKTSVKQAGSASKMARPPVKHKSEAEAKSANGVQSIKTPPTAHEVKESEELNAAKIKTEVKSPAPIKTLAKPAVSVGKAIGGPTKPEANPAAAPAVHPAKPAAAAPVVPLPGVAKPARQASAEGGPTARADESMAPKAAAKAAAPRHGFKAHEFVVYPAHGVGQIVAIEEQEVAGFRLELFVITFVKDKMMLRVPVGKAPSVGMRKLSDPDLVKKSLDTLLGRARIKRTMWSRRAQEYEAKINSGDLIAIAEVVRDLYRSEAQPEQSYSERQLYEAALDRMAREVAVVQKVDEAEALKLIEGQLQKGQRGRKAEAAPAGDAASDADVEEAA